MCIALDIALILALRIVLKKQRYIVLFERLPSSCVLLLYSCRMFLKKDINATTVRNSMILSAISLLNKRPQSMAINRCSLLSLFFLPIARTITCLPFIAVRILSVIFQPIASVESLLCLGGCIFFTILINVQSFYASLKINANLVDNAICV